MASFEYLCTKYLKEFQSSVRSARALGVGSVEMATRPVVHGFIESLVRHSEASPGRAIVHHDITVTAGNRPDWWIEDKDTFGVFAYGDHKNLSDLVPFVFTNAEREQMSRYLRLGRPVFVFDGIEFIFLSPDDEQPFHNPKKYSLVSKPLKMAVDWSTLPIEPQVEIQFAKLLQAPGFRKWNENDLIEQLAQRARLISEEIALLLDAPVGSGANRVENDLMIALHDLQNQLATHHDPFLVGNRPCADFVAQVLIFGMFYAHTQAPSNGPTPELRHDLIRSFWTDEAYVKVAERLRPFQIIATILRDSLSVPNGLSSWYRDAAAVLAHAEYVGASPGPTDFHVLFERFLASFSPSMRFDYGTWYTPAQLTTWMVEFADTISRASFGHGIAGFTKKVIDPCVGTGGFLEAYVKFAQVSGGVASELVGFEVLPAPYALAQYRLASVIKDSPFEGRLHLLLTDTLSDQIDLPPYPVAHELDKEVVEASEWARLPLTLVLGNPPSTINALSGSSRTRIEGLLDDFRPPVALRTDRQNTQKALNNEAYRFLRWCADRVVASENGIILLVLPGSFIHAVSLRYARAWMMKHFDELFVLELDEDARNGSGTSSIFNVLQGRAVLIAVKGGSRKGVRHHSIASMPIASKFEYLTSPPVLSEFREVEGGQDQFAPVIAYDFDTWRLGWPLRVSEGEDGVFNTKCSGVKLGLTALVHVDRFQLIRRSKALSALPLKKYQEIRSAWFEGQAKPPKEEKLTAQVRSAIGNAVIGSTTNIVNYTFRPFVRSQVILDDGVFQSLIGLGGGGTRDRPEVRAAFAQGAKAILVAPAPMDLGSTLTRFVSFAWDLPDNDNASRGNAMVYCDRCPAAPPMRNRTWNSAAVVNVSRSIAELFSEFPAPESAVLFYVYAVMSCESYLSKFEPILYSSSDPDRPFRVPIAAEDFTRQQIVNLGSEIANLENFDIEIELSSAAAFIWSDEFEELKLKKFKIDDLHQQIELIGESGEVVRVEGFDTAVLTHRISGYNVIDRWLRERQFVYSRRSFTKNDCRELLDVLTRIERQLEVLLSVDALVRPLLEDQALLIKPPGIMSK